LEEIGLAKKIKQKKEEISKGKGKEKKCSLMERARGETSRARARE